MADMREIAEHVEHAGHGGHAAGLSKNVGLTMAVLGVLLAFCSALVGGARTELIATMVEQTGASLKFSAVSTKYRMMQSQLQSMHAFQPDAKTYAEHERQLVVLEANTTKPGPDLEVQVVRAEMRKVLSAVVPTREDVLRFAASVKKLDDQQEAAEKWAESYEDAVKAHSLMAEHFEWGLLCAEVGIVMASIALLLSHKREWIISLVLGVTCLVIISATTVVARGQLHAAEAKIAAAEHHFKSIDVESSERVADEKLIDDIEHEVPLVDLTGSD